MTMQRALKPTFFWTSQSLFKGASRVADLFGELDEHKSSKNADYVALENDWKNVGNAISDSIVQYERSRKIEQPARSK